jgi:hypothetical protein
MTNLTRASKELFRRPPDECYPSMAALAEFCQWQKDDAVELWQSPSTLSTQAVDSDRLLLSLDDGPAFQMNDWSFSQLCRLGGVSKETVNRLTPATAERVFRETLPQGSKPLQLFTHGGELRSIHPPSYTRLYNGDLLALVREFAVDFEPPQKGCNDATGLYAGEQDMFCFLIDPTGWTEIGEMAFAPGFFVWNSEVGSRSIGIETFWFQAVCSNHIVWDAVEIVQFTRKHTANVHESLDEIRRIIESLVARRDERRDGFVKVVRRAMETRLGGDAEEVRKILAQRGIGRTLGKLAVEFAEQDGAFTIFSLVDALTRIGGTLKFAADRTAVDQKAAQLLALAL